MESTFSEIVIRFQNKDHSMGRKPSFKKLSTAKTTVGVLGVVGRGSRGSRLGLEMAEE